MYCDKLYGASHCTVGDHDCVVKHMLLIVVVHRHTHNIHHCVHVIVYHCSCTRGEAIVIMDDEEQEEYLQHLRDVLEGLQQSASGSTDMVATPAASHDPYL